MGKALPRRALGCQPDPPATAAACSGGWGVGARRALDADGLPRHPSYPCRRPVRPLPSLRPLLAERGDGGCD
eukprot:9499266-Pyramimonas_sp.AAC.1